MPSLGVSWTVYYWSRDGRPARGADRLDRNGATPTEEGRSISLARCRGRRPATTGSPGTVAPGSSPGPSSNTVPSPRGGTAR